MDWTPELGAEARHVPEASTVIADSRVAHYWDPDTLLGNAFRGTLGSTRPVWDVWMVFDRETTWRESNPPEPAWWEHQLEGLPLELRLDPDRFAGRAAELLERQGSL